VQARDLGSTRQALKKRLYGTGRKGTVPITENKDSPGCALGRSCRYALRARRAEALSGDLAFLVAFSFSHAHLPGTIPDPHISDFQASELAHPQASLQ